MNLKNLFKENEWELISEVLRLGNFNSTWYDLAQRHGIRPEGNTKQRSTAANDVYRRFLKLLKRNQLDLTVVKQTVNSNGDVLFETRKRIPESVNPSTEGMIIDRITTNPQGGEWISYRNPVETKVQEQSVLNAVKKLIDEHVLLIPDTAFREPVEKETWFQDSKRLAVVNLYDAHLDKLPIKSSCGVESTLEENIEKFLDTVDRICVELVKNDVDDIIFPLGNDLFHTNGFNSQTKKGTQIEYYGSPEDNYYAICNAVTEAVTKLAVVAKKGVKVIMVKGNHDEDKITVLGYWLEKLFQGTNVDVDFTRRQRKYIKFGENLLGFAHGDKEKSKIAQLPLIMAQESKQEWGTTTYRKMYLGDLHHGFEYQFLKAKDMPGVEVEYLRSVGTTDTWHEDFGWIGIPKTAYLQIFDEKEGEINRMKFNIK
jgi:UDP-2,3-diacylglucosamine pyrophosphatase LpxH